VVRIENGVLAEHWDVLQDEATQAESKSGLPGRGVRAAGFGIGWRGGWVASADRPRACVGQEREVNGGYTMFARRPGRCGRPPRWAARGRRPGAGGSRR
jgi:hypothetical protein